ncbi:MAG: XRE family transcriptional regulator [Bdellovibrio sp.]|nr:MAG: XRE family transcriptional regulator [Bdellovibrio sp.]
MGTKRTGIAEIEKRYGRLTFGRLLKSHREGEELSQVVMAEKLGLSKQSLNDLEHGRKIPSIGRAVQIAKKIGLMEDLIVQLVLQDQVDREKIHVKVTVAPVTKRAS